MILAKEWEWMISNGYWSELDSLEAVAHRLSVDYGRQEAEKIIQTFQIKGKEEQPYTPTHYLGF